MITFIKKYKGMLLKAYILINNINIYFINGTIEFPS